MITAWRIVAPEWADDAFSGEGARKRSARWHKSPARIVYTSGSVALATLELIVNVPRALRLSEYSVVSCIFPEAIVENLDASRLPKHWRDYPGPPELQRMGSEWLANRSCAVLAVPSAVVPEELNFLINPEHDDFRTVKIGLPRPFELDLRLIT